MTLLHIAQLWKLTATLTKRQDAAYHRWERISGVFWKDRVTNEDTRTRTGKAKIENILKEKRLRCGSVI